MGHQDWGPENAFYNPKPALLKEDRMVIVGPRARPDDVIRLARSALRLLNKGVADREDLRIAAKVLRTAALEADERAWHPGEGQKAFPELRIKVSAVWAQDRVEYAARSTWGHSSTASTPRAAVDRLLDQELPVPEAPPRTRECPRGSASARTFSDRTGQAGRGRSALPP